MKMASSKSAETIAGTETSKEIKEQYKKFVKRKILFIFALISIIFIIAGIAATLGAYQISFTEVYSIIWHGIFQDPVTDEELVVWNLRLPRIIMAILAGFGLAVAGVMMQGILRNPLASPFTIGIASGAGFGAAIAICFGTGLVAGEYLVIVNAFIFALIPTFIILGLARYRSATPETMILAGIALFYIFSGLIALVMYFSEAEPMREAYFWMVGSLSKASGWKSFLVFIVVVGCIIPLMWKAWDINVMGAGDETAKSLGVNVDRTRIFVMVIASLLTAGIVCFTGTIGFIGLVSPHICRIIIGGDNRFLIPASGLFGAVLLLSADIVAVNIMPDQTLPVGILTYLMGGPLFLYLIIRRKKEYW